MSHKPEYIYYLQEEFDRRIDRNSKYSLRSFARFLDIDPGALSKILSYKKIISPQMGLKIAPKLDLDYEQRQNFLTSVAKEQKKKKKVSKKLVKDLIKRKSSKQYVDLSPQVFRVMSAWYHYAILQLIKIKGVKVTPKEISKRFSISPTESLRSLERLETLEIIEKKNDSYIRTQENLTTGDPVFTNSALRKRIKQIHQKSIESLENDPIELRSHTTMTMAINPEKIPQAKILIDRFMDDLSELLEEENQQQKVYELSVNLFPLERRKK